MCRLDRREGICHFKQDDNRSEAGEGATVYLGKAPHVEGTQAKALQQI